MEMEMIVGRREVICQPLPTTAHLAPLDEHADDRHTSKCKMS